MSDNRDITNNYKDAEYHSLVAAINYNYAKKHNYDFIYYVPSVPSYHKINNVNHAKNMKHKINSYNSLLKQYRSASWTKLITLFDALSKKYKHIVYIDSDSVLVNPDVSLDKYLNNAVYTRGNKNSELQFLIDKPHSDGPCAGAIIVNNNLNAKKALKYWWNYNIPEFNKVHSFEQEALRSMIVHNKDPLMEPYCAIIDDLSFQPKDDQFIRHVCHLEADKRMDIFRCWYEKLYGSNTFTDTINTIINNNTKSVDIIKLENNIQEYN